ncbi:MAG: HAMP domain-containing sensor histidine kinase [Pirellula sp.]
MKAKTVILIVLIVLLPLLLLAWAAMRMAESEQDLVQRRFLVLMEDRLRDVNRNIKTFFDDAERHLQTVTQLDELDVESLRETIRREPRVLQIFVLSERGQLLYPNPTQPLNTAEQNFLRSTAKMFTGQDLRDAVLQTENNSDSSRSNSQSQSGTQLPSRSDSTNRMAAQSAEPGLQPNEEQQVERLFKESNGWFTWYWDRGMNLIYWQRRPSGRIVGAALERGRWIADLIAELPNTVDHAESSSVQATKEKPTLETRMRLVNASAETIYQWGPFEAPSGTEPFCEIPVAAPLSSWRLQCLIPVDQIGINSRGASAGLMVGLAAVAMALSSMAWELYRDYSMGMREAAQQVSFVNQVSHELKTPLTNIRLYAELMERDLTALSAADAKQPMHRLSVILSESERLSRLIGNVLTLARQQRRSLQPQAQSIIPNELIQHAVDRFRPSLEDLSIEMNLRLDAKRPMNLDPDFLEQILANLISNVEKYAAAGRSLRIQSSQDGDRLSILVEDSGPGIPKSKWSEVFRPFTRLSNSVSAAAGTGIGLSIARELARLHGGNISLEDCQTGCRFLVTLRELRMETV